MTSGRDVWMSPKALGKICCTAADLDGDASWCAVLRHQIVNYAGVVLDRTIAKLFSLAVQDADLNRILVVIKTDKNWYTGHGSLLLKGFWASPNIS